MLPLIALRNLSRNQRRTLLSLLVVCVGFIGLLLTAGFVRASFVGLREAVIQGGLGHLEVVPAADLGAANSADRTGRPPGFAGWREIRDTIEHQPHVRAAGATIQFAGVATNGGSSASFVGLAVEPDRERRMGMAVRLREGASLPEAEGAGGEDQVLLGVGLARALGAAPGDTIAVMAATPDGSLNAVDMVVAGLFTTGFQELDGRILKTSVADAQRLLGTERVTSVIVGLTETSTTPQVETALRQLLTTGPAPLSIVTWETRAPFYGQVRALYGSIFAFLGTIVALLVALSISNTMLMSVLERVREFGTLLAIGTSRAQLAQMLIFEALWLAAIGALAGSALGFGLVTLINALHIEMPPPPAAVDPILLELLVQPSDFLWIFGAMTIILAAAAIPPMLRVFRLQIVDALGHV
ncbi:MAG: FtsX-like permease family protein [Vicinamibacterales bacterium]